MLIIECYDNYLNQKQIFVTAYTLCMASAKGAIAPAAQTVIPQGFFMGAVAAPEWETTRIVGKAYAAAHLPPRYSSI